MVKQTGRKTGGTVRRRRSGYVENPGLKQEKEFTTSAKRALAFRRFWLFLLTAVLLAVGIASACGARFF